MYMETARISLF